jgi:hypothetical protein
VIGWDADLQLAGGAAHGPHLNSTSVHHSKGHHITIDSIEEMMITSVQ